MVVINIHIRCNYRYIYITNHLTISINNKKGQSRCNINEIIKSLCEGKEPLNLYSLESFDYISFTILFCFFFL